MTEPQPGLFWYARLKKDDESGAVDRFFGLQKEIETMDPATTLVVGPFTTSPPPKHDLKRAIRKWREERAAARKSWKNNPQSTKQTGPANSYDHPPYSRTSYNWKDISEADKNQKPTVVRL